MQITAPLTQDALMERAYSLAGLTIGDLAKKLHKPIPTHLVRSKGFIGQLLELALGADAQQLDQPDFLQLQIELKTLPVDPSGKPRESTFICTASLPMTETDFFSSRVWRKIAQVLWFPILTLPQQPLAQRRIGAPLLWSPDETLTALLKQDWEELTTLLTLGEFEQISAHQGTYLQIRPKAANAKTFIQVIDQHGERISTVPKGFYARTQLTQEIIEKGYLR